MAVVLVFIFKVILDASQKHFSESGCLMQKVVNLASGSYQILC